MVMVYGVRCTAISAFEVGGVHESMGFVSQLYLGISSTATTLTLAIDPFLMIESESSSNCAVQQGDGWNDLMMMSALSVQEDVNEWDPLCWLVWAGRGERRAAIHN